MMRTRHSGWNKDKIQWNKDQIQRSIMLSKKLDVRIKVSLKSKVSCTLHKNVTGTVELSKLCINNLE